MHRGDSIDAEDGLDVITTLDVELQHIADATLRRQMTAERAIWGTVIVMDVQTGDLLALANLGETSELSGVYYEKDNYAFNRRIEPGSTFKLVSLLALTEDMKQAVSAIAERILAGEAQKTPSADACRFCAVRANCDQACKS